MSKINKSPSNYNNKIKSGKVTFDDKGFYLRESQLLRNEDDLLIGTENKDNILLNIKTRDTVDVRSKVENERNIDHG
jgi:hypothetical protein